MKRSDLLCALVVGVLVACQAGEVLAQPVFISASRRVKFAKGDNRGVEGLKIFKQTVEDLKKLVGDRKVKAYIVTDNLGASGEIAAAMQRIWADTPYGGAANNWHDYLPIHRDTLADGAKNVDGIVITAICGDVDVQIEMVGSVPTEEVDYKLPEEQIKAHWDRLRPGIVAKGEELAKKFKFPTRSDLTTVLMISGAMHTPRQEFVFEGVKKALPKNVMLIGGATADFGNVYYKGKAAQTALYGVRISGEFKAVATGSKGGRNAGVSLPAHLKQLTTELGDAKPTAMIYFGCAGWRRDLDVQQKALQYYLPKGVGVYGQYCGGEIGRLKDATESVADTDLGVIILMGASGKPGRPTRAISVAVPPSPDASPFLSEDNFVTNWLVLGPIAFKESDFGGGDQSKAADNEFVKNEAALDGRQKAPDGAKWQAKLFNDSDTAGKVDLDALFGAPEHSVAYCVAWLEAPTDLADLALHVGSDDYLKIWINGKEVFKYNAARRGSDWDQDEIKGITLKKGYNRVVVKCVDIVSDWNFYFRLTDKDDMPFTFKPKK